MAESVDGQHISTTKELAAFIRKTPRRVQQLGNDGVCFRVPGETNKWYTFRSLGSYIQFIEGSSKLSDQATVEAIREDKQSKAAISKQLAQEKMMDMLERKELLVDREWVISLWREHSQKLNRLVQEYITKLHREVPDIEADALERMHKHQAELQSHIRAISHETERDGTGATE